MDYDSIENCECRRPILGMNECMYCGVPLCDWCPKTCRRCQQSEEERTWMQETWGDDAPPDGGA